MVRRSRAAREARRGGSPRRTDAVVERAPLLAPAADAFEQLVETDPRPEAQLPRDMIAGADDGSGRMSREIAGILGA